jgi:hypothetical protein
MKTNLDQLREDLRRERQEFREILERVYQEDLKIYELMLESFKTSLEKLEDSPSKDLK